MPRYIYAEVMGHCDWDYCPECIRVYYYVPARPANPPTWEHWCPWCHNIITDLDDINVDLSPTHSAFKLQKGCPRLHGVGNAPPEDAPADPNDYALGAAGPEEDALGPDEDYAFGAAGPEDRQPLAAPGLVWTP